MIGDMCDILTSFYDSLMTTAQLFYVCDK